MKNALLLSGGGARAAYQVGVLKAMAELLPDHCRNPFPIICGTSAGAINAVSLAAHRGSFQQSVSYLEDIWMNLEPGDVYRDGWWEVVRGIANFGLSLFNQGVGVGKPLSLLDNSPLQDLLERTIEFGKIDRAIARGDLEAISVSAMGYTSGHSVSFFQGRPELESWSRYRRKARRTLLGVDHLLASSAIPTIFPATRLEEEYYGDGAMRQLSPISPALHLGADQVFIIGVSGNRHPNIKDKRRKTTHSPSIAQILGHMFNSTFIDSLDSDMEHLMRINRLVKANPEIETPSGKRKLKYIESLMISPSEEVDRIAGQNICHLPASMRAFLRTTGGNNHSGGTVAASYLLFAKPFIEQLIALGHKDALWSADSIQKFFKTAP